MSLKPVKTAEILNFHFRNKFSRENKFHLAAANAEKEKEKLRNLKEISKIPKNLEEIEYINDAGIYEYSNISDQPTQMYFISHKNHFIYADEVQHDGILLPSGEKISEFKIENKLQIFTLSSQSLNKL